MIKRDLHVHTTYCDGKDSPEEMVKAAIQKGMDSIGFSAHSYTFFDESYCMKKEKIEEYKKEISALKEKYQGKIKILCGIEQDAYSKEPTDGYDYVIGSVHYIKCGENYIPVDEDKETLMEAIDECYDGDPYSLVEEYYRTVKDVAKVTGATIIGHFDLISKFNADGSLFDEENPRYTKAWMEAADELLKANIPFEINTGAISRGYKTLPYPSEPIRKYIKEKGGAFILSGDAHSKDTLCYKFEEFEKLF